MTRRGGEEGGADAAAASGGPGLLCGAAGGGSRVAGRVGAAADQGEAPAPRGRPAQPSPAPPGPALPCGWAPAAPHPCSSKDRRGRGGGAGAGRGGGAAADVRELCTAAGCGEGGLGGGQGCARGPAADRWEAGTSLPGRDAPAGGAGTGDPSLFLPGVRPAGSAPSPASSLPGRREVGARPTGRRACGGGRAETSPRRPRLPGSGGRAGPGAASLGLGPLRPSLSVASLGAAGEGPSAWPQTWCLRFSGVVGRELTYLSGPRVFSVVGVLEVWMPSEVLASRQL